MARSEAKIKAGAAPFLEDGEEVLAAFVARPRGWTAADWGKIHENTSAAADAGFPVGDYAITRAIGLAVTQRRLLSLAIAYPIGWGIAVKVKGLMGAIPVGLVDDIKVRRLALGKVVTVTVRGVPFTLEVGAGGNVNGVVDAVNRAKAAAA
jgi:hypothetical protein